MSSTVTRSQRLWEVTHIMDLHKSAATIMSEWTKVSEESFQPLVESEPCIIRTLI